jgi:hypothetical protein
MLFYTSHTLHCSRGALNQAASFFIILLLSTLLQVYLQISAFSKAHGWGLENKEGIQNQ